MKKNLLLLLITISLCSCDELPFGNDVIWDVSPVEVNIYVQDSQGNDLLSSSFEGNILKDSIYVEYGGIKFPIGVDMSEETMTRAYLAVLTGLKLRKYGNENYLSFGEFDGTKDWNDVCSIHWGDGTSDNIRFVRDFKWALDGSPKVKESAFYLNNEKVKGKIIIIR